MAIIWMCSSRGFHDALATRYRIGRLYMHRCMQVISFEPKSKNPSLSLPSVHVNATDYVSRGGYETCLLDGMTYGMLGPDTNRKLQSPIQNHFIGEYRPRHEFSIAQHVAIREWSAWQPIVSLKHPHVSTHSCTYKPNYLSVVCILQHQAR